MRRVKAARPGGFFYLVTAGGAGLESSRNWTGSVLQDGMRCDMPEPAATLSPAVYGRAERRGR